MRPQLPAGPRGEGRRSRLGSFFLGTWRGRILGVALAAGTTDVVLSALGRGLPGPVMAPAWTVLTLAFGWLVLRGLGWLSGRLLWRIRTKLILSYLFVALVPLVLVAIFFVTAGILLLLVSSSRLVTTEVERITDACLATAESSLAGLPPGDAAASAALEERLGPVRALHPGAAWTLLRGGRVAASHGAAPRALPKWWKGEAFASLVRIPSGSGPGRDRGPGAALLRVAVSRGDAVLVVDVPADGRLFASLEARSGIHVVQADEMRITNGEERGERRTGVRATVGRRENAVDYEQGGRRVTVDKGEGLGFVSLPAQRDWETGGPSRETFVPLLFRFQPLDFVRRLAPELPKGVNEWGSLADILLYALGVVAAVFLVVYAVALALGLGLARQITRGVHELSIGTNRLRAGGFGHAIPIRSRDQLGELAESFNEMSRDIQQLMRAEAEKERLEEELRIARTIQMSLLPGDDLVRMRGLRVAALCLPAAEVGGDYYDVLPLGPTRLGVLVADVSGKGTSAALYMAELKGLVLSLSRIHESPARLLSEANRILSANMDSRSFVTMTYAVVDTAARRMRFARAGHNPVIHLEARTRRTRVLAPAGLGLGLDAGDRFDQILQEDEVALDPGDFFLFFTDGLSEAMSPAAELFGEGRLRRILEDGEGLDSEAMKERILAEVRQFVGDAAPHDDMTLVVLKVVAEEAPA
jgi:serine phosphatase RsbU (regulator of sigma subunit)